MKSLGVEGVCRLGEKHGWRKLSFVAAGVVIVLAVVAQFVYPWDVLPMNASIQGINVGGQSVAEATKLLNEKYANLSIKLYFGESKKAYRNPKPADIGLKIDVAPAVHKSRYEWWQRLIPTSVFWAHVFGAGDKNFAYTSDEAKAATYIEKEFGKSCKVDPQNANVEYRDESLQVIPAIDGGNCKTDEVLELLTNAKPTLRDSAIRIAITPRPAAVTDQEAGEFISKLQARTATGLAIAIDEKSAVVDQPTLLSWLDFEAPDSGIVAKVNQKRSQKFFDEHVAPHVAKPAGTSYVTTRDFTVISEKAGPSGQALDYKATIGQIDKWLAGKEETVSAQVYIVAPNVVYTRKYSPTDTGLTALITQFAESHPGQFGVSFIELDGLKRRAAYKDTKQFRTASTYKLFVAYSTLRRIDSGKWKWSDSVISGKNLSKCFDDMIVLSDNPCAEALLEKITPATVHKEIQQIGLKNTSFIGKYIMTTAGDLTTFVGALQMGQLPLSNASRNTLLNAMERNVHRQGIPAGAKGTVADKVGFLPDPNDGIWYYNDAAIVYSPTGTYALSIMTKGSSWATIAELTRQIEKLRSQ